MGVVIIEVAKKEEPERQLTSYIGPALDKDFSSLPVANER
jgi:hypothetical protein